MKNVVLGLIIIALLGLCAYYVYDRYMIEELSEAIVHENIPDVVPERIKKDAIEIKKGLSKKSDDIVTYLNQNQISLEEFNKVIDNIEYYEVQKFIERAKKQKFKNADEAFDFIKQNFDLGDIPVEKFRDDFIKNYNSEKFDKALNYFDQNDDQMKIMFPIAKETLKKMLREKYEAKDSVP